jgi:hypothetical protein
VRPVSTRIRNNKGAIELVTAEYFKRISFTPTSRELTTPFKVKNIQISLFYFSVNF